ncbi:TrkA C-terminal domain-containing protein [Actinacidiphila oryziradicis]|uniref:TrkA C-terminal domain-containing protein n=1 Tax=Actinacidiphila oryziradicis TaxID=2571141 RepID=UPI001FE8FA29|nr:TrkA C-terminal domain-containing protein [Actinacidiphila oryziradicis]
MPVPAGTVVAAVIRDGEPAAPTPGLRLQPGDELLLVSHTATEKDVQTAFQ